MPTPSDMIAEIRGWHRRRVAAMEIRKRADLALGANLRTWLGWRRDLDESKRKAIEALALDLIACGEIEAKREKIAIENIHRDEQGKKPKQVPEPHRLADTEEFAEYRDFIGMAVLSREPTDRYEAIATKAMEQLATQLPVWPFAESIRGLGARSLAVIVGEAGDLSAYATHSKLWKRMAMAPYSKDGVTRSGQQWKIKGGLDKDDWIAFGYRARRRAQMFVIEGNLIKATDAYYRLYLARKDYLRNRATFEGKTVAPSAKIPKGRADEFVSDGEINSQAKHYMGKKLLRVLWGEWRKAVVTVPETASLAVPSAAISNAREGEVLAGVPVPKGQRRFAGTSSDAAPAAGEVQQKLPAKAHHDVPPHPSRAAPDGAEAARRAVPKGRSRIAASNNKKAPRGAEAARLGVPQGQGIIAASTPSDASPEALPAAQSLPQGQIWSADTNHAPQGAGRAKSAVPARATIPLPGRKSKVSA